MRGGENLETRARSVSERLPGRQLSLTPLRLDSFSINSLSVDEWSLLDWVFIELARSEQDSRAVRYIEFTSESTASGWMRSRSATRFLTCTEGGGVQGVGRGGARGGSVGGRGGQWWGGVGGTSSTSACTASNEIVISGPSFAPFCMST